MNKKYEYTKKEDKDAKYNEYILNKEKIIPAIYSKAVLERDRGNAYIEALPNINLEPHLSEKPHELIEYRHDKIKNMSKTEKKLQVSNLRYVRFPLPFQKELIHCLYNTIISSYRARTQVYTFNSSIECSIKNKSCELNVMLTGEASQPTNSGFSLIGKSGAGKTTLMSETLSQYPQVIIHNDEDGGYYVQIVYLVVNCVPNSNFSALYEGVGSAIDHALQNTDGIYQNEISKCKGLGKKAAKVKELIEKLAIGIIIFDEIQLIDFNHTKENTFDSLLTLANETKVGLAVIGTEDARDKMFSELRTSRRIGENIIADSYCDNFDFFRFLVTNVFKYQWFDELVEPDDDICVALYEVTKGIIDQLIGIYIKVNEDYLDKKEKPQINGEYIKKVAKKYFSGMQDVLQNIYPNHENKTLTATDIVNNYTQAEQIREIINSNNDKRGNVKDANVYSNISAIYDYSLEEVENGIKIIRKKNSGDITEKELTRKVVEYLNKKNRHRNNKKKPIPPDVTHMKNFLGIKEE